MIFAKYDLFNSKLELIIAKSRGIFRQLKYTLLSRHKNLKMSNTWGN